MNNLSAISIRKLFTLSLMIFIFGAAVIVAQSSVEPVGSQNYALINGNWFDGRIFKKRTFYSVNGVFSNEQPKRVDETIDLKNGFVIPPFSDAQNRTFAPEIRSELSGFGRRPAKEFLGDKKHQAAV